jgi:hypothetical protein
VIYGSDRRGYQFGSGLIDRSHQRFILHIPKNASSFILDWATGTGHWHVHALADVQHHASLQEVIIVLRDPVQRWLSGFSQYACSWILNASRFFDTATGPSSQFQRQTGSDFVTHYNWLTERLIFDNLETFDDHVWPQTSFFEDLLPDVARKYFLLDRDFDPQFMRYLDLPAPNLDLDRNRGDADPDMQKIRQFLQARLDSVPELMTAIKQAYQRDYEVIEALRCQ